MRIYNYYLMLATQESSKRQARRARMAGIRSSLKDIPLLQNNKKRLQNSVKNYISPTTDDSSNFSEEIDSNGSLHHLVSSKKPDLSTYNAFLEKYQLLEKLGEGGNGCVYKCQHKANKKIYAVKKFKVEEEHILELKRNFISIQKLKHTSICGYKALYFDARQRFAFLVMEYFPFPDLSTYHLTSEEELKSVVRQLIAGLEYLHKHNLCHRDIKPENILYDQKEGTVKIIDFGISKKTFSRGVRRDMLTIIGTNFYFAPEIYIGGGYDERVDIWALGVTIYKLIAGYTPFESEYHSDTIANILKGEVTYDEKVWGKYSPFAKNLVSRLLKTKHQRMSLRQSLKHLWFHYQSNQDLIKQKRRSSFCLQISEEFKREMRNSQQAASKEEGSSKVFSNFRKSIKLINVNQFDLSDSEEQLVDIENPRLQLRSCILIL